MGLVRTVRVKGWVIHYCYKSPHKDRRMCVCIYTLIAPESFINQPVTAQLPRSSVCLELKQMRCNDGVHTVKAFTCIDLITSFQRSGKHICCDVRAPLGD